MKGNFKITLAYLNEIGACRDGQREFQRAFPDGAEYQEVLDRCAEEGRVDFGTWLLDRLGSTDETRTYEDEVNEPEKTTNLENLRLLAYLKYTDKEGVTRDLGIGTWNGRSVLIDDSMPAEEVAAETGDDGETTASGYVKYTTYLLGDGAFDYEDIGAKVPYEMKRDPAKNGGQDTLYSRQRKVFAPYGISWTKKSQASNSPTDEELKTAGNWTLVHNGESAAKAQYIDHKAIPIARIISRG